MWKKDGSRLISAIETLSDGHMISMGQCGFIIASSGKKIATDVIVSDLYYKGTDISRRVVKPPFAVSQCPDIDLFLISHDHADHFDRALVTDLASCGRKSRVIAPARILDSLDMEEENKIYLRDYEEYSDGAISVIPIPVLHYGYEHSRAGFSVFNGYAIRCSGISLFHAGDTIVSERLIEDVRKAGPFDYGFLPINGRDRERESRGIIGNMNEDEAVSFALGTGIRTVFPTHFDFFRENGADPQIFRKKAEGKVGVIIPEPGAEYAL